MNQKLLKAIKMDFIALAALFIGLLCVSGCEFPWEKSKTARIEDLRVEYMQTPLGIDLQKPRFSWRMHAVEEIRGIGQKAYRIVVSDDDSDVWDSGKIESDVALGIEYAGPMLEPTTRYTWDLTVWDQDERIAKKSSWFETGLMSTDGVTNWDGAQWIGGDDYALDAKSKPIFIIEFDITIPEGSTKGSFIFGANDPRLLDANKNNYGIAGENYIKYELDVFNAVMNIYRVGYGPQTVDGQKIMLNEDVPFATVDIDSALLNEENAHATHTIRLACPDSSIMTYLDGELIDSAEHCSWDRCYMSGRVLNPLGSANEGPHYPRLNEIGFAVEDGESARFDNLKISEYPSPNAVLFSETFDSEYTGIFRNALNASYFSLADGEIVLDGSSGEVMVTRDPSHSSVPMLRTLVNSGGVIEKARLYASARGIYEFYINGQKVGDEFFNPGHGEYGKHIMYQTHDITDMLERGENVIGAMLSSGWWNDMGSYSMANYNYCGDRQSLLAKIEITYRNGTTKTIVTNTTEWQYYGNGPVRYGAFFNGEKYDATLEADIDGWSMPAYDASAWKSPVQIAPKEAFAHPQVVARIGNGVKAVETIMAKSYSEPRPGVYVYDMGVNMVGVPRVTLIGEMGQVVTLRTGEILYPDLAKYADINGVSLAGMILTENLRRALSTDTYICKGYRDGETFQPRFTFHGYRYLEITGIDEPLPVEDVQGVVLSSLTEMTGHYETSNELVNQLYKNILRSQYGDFLSIPTDCPQRDERMGWGGDAQVFARTAGFNADVDQFFNRFMQILRDGQDETSGMFPTFAPSYGSKRMIGLAWSAAGVIIPWEMYQQYGDTRIIEDSYASMKAFMDGLAANIKPGFTYLTDRVGGLADHIAYAETDVDMLSNAVYVSMIRKMAHMADVIGNESDAAAYYELYAAAKAEWNSTYVDASTHVTKAADGTIQDTQASYSLPLSYNLFSDEHAAAAAARLAQISETLGYIVTTGFIGTASLNPVLSDYGYDDVAYRLLESTDYPSWLYPVVNGATSIWERWNSYTVEDGFGANNYMNSFNHYSLGSVGAWMYNYSLGIQRDSEYPGFKHFILQPRFGGTMTFARGYYDSMYGRIEAAWELDGNDFKYTVTVPANTTAIMYLPATSEENVSESGKAASNAEGVILLSVEENKLVYELQSGIYEFKSDLTGLLRTSSNK